MLRESGTMNGIIATKDLSKSEIEQKLASFNKLRVCSYRNQSKGKQVVCTLEGLNINRPKGRAVWN